jgi:Rps23 Pro-64 3,4-dihydroxylase Tpa1-like proline 4-hydroxylase
MKTLDEFVMIVDDVLPEDLASNLLNEYVDSSDWMGAPPGKGGSIYGDYPAKAVLITQPQIINKSPIRQQLCQDVLASIRNAFDRYHEKFSRREQGLNFLHIDSMVGLRLIRYETGQYMGIHTDKYPDSESGQVSWPAVTFSINVNDDFEGGELILLDGDIVFKGAARQGIIFPANFMYPHSVEKVTSGTRYSLAGWFR